MLSRAVNARRLQTVAFACLPKASARASERRVFAEMSLPSTVPTRRDTRMSARQRIDTLAI